MSVAITPEQVQAGLVKVKENIDKHAPNLSPILTPVITKLDKQAPGIAKLGTDITLQALSYWAVVNPFGDPPRMPAGYAAGRAEIQGAGDRLQDDRDAEIQAMKELRELVLEVGKDAIKLAIPFLVAALL